MKRLVLLVMSLIIGTSAVFADCEYSCVTPYDMNNKFRAVVGALSGVNTIAEWQAEAIIRKEIFKFAKVDNLKVDFDTYSAKDAKNGIFKSMKVSAKNVLINDIYLSTMNARTLCDFNYVKQEGKKIIFVEDLPMAFEFTMTQDDINKTMLHPRYKKVVDDLNSLVGSFARGVKISSTKVKIENGKFYYIAGFGIPFIRKEQTIVFCSDIGVKNGKIDLHNSKIVSSSFNIDLKRADFLLSKLNPLDFSVKVLKNKKARVYVNNIKTVNDAFVVDGIMVVPKESHG